MGLISPAGENLLDFTQLRLVLSSYDGSSETPLLASGKASPHASYQGASRDSLPSMPVLRPYVESGPDPEDASPVLT